jgi:hypothetical protein
VTLEAQLGIATNAKDILVTIKNPCYDSDFVNIVPLQVNDIHHTLMTATVHSWYPFNADAEENVLSMCGGISYEVTMKSGLDNKSGALDEYFTVDYTNRMISLNVDDRIVLRSPSYTYTVKGFLTWFPEGPVFSESTGTIIFADVCTTPDEVLTVPATDVDATFGDVNAFEFPEWSVVPNMCGEAALFLCEYTTGPYTGTDFDLCSFNDGNGNAATFDSHTGLHTFNPVDMVVFPQGVYEFKLTVRVGDKDAEITHSVHLVQACEESPVIFTDPFIDATTSSPLELEYTLNAGRMSIPFSASGLGNVPTNPNCGEPKIDFLKSTGEPMQDIFNFDVVNS